MDKKRILGQFFTRDELWLKPQVVDFINKSATSIAYDPFAGAGDLLKAVKEKCGFLKTVGLDIDNSLDWQYNDSLLDIPHLEDAIIITNPPYISNYSAARKGILSDLSKYFKTSNYTDIYMIALDKMILAQKNIVAIIPETFINSNYAQKNLLESITILEENPFEDTETPVIVACFDGIAKDFSEIKVYKNKNFINSLGKIESLRLKPHFKSFIAFNDPGGWLAVRCVDTTSPKNMIKFDLKENIKYDWEHRIKVSSRLLTLINVDIPRDERLLFIKKCNKILEDMRQETSDVILSPFKGNMKDGRRRRRLDFRTCRAIIERAYEEMYEKNKDCHIQPNLYPTKETEEKNNVNQ